MPVNPDDPSTCASPMWSGWTARYQRRVDSVCGDPTLT